MENWQLCPKCKGDDVINNHSGVRCRICDGSGLINMITGKPANVKITGHSGASDTTTTIPFNPNTPMTFTKHVIHSDKELSKIYSNKS